MEDETIQATNGKEDDSELDAIHTLGTDAADFIHEENTNAVRVAPQRILPGSIKPADSSERKRSQIRAVIAFLILAASLSIGILIVKRAYDDRIKRTELPEVKPNTFLILDATEDVDVNVIDRESSKDASEPRGKITRLRVVSNTEVLNTSDFIKSIGATPPADLPDHFNDQFILARVGMGEATSSVPAIIFQLTSYSHVASGMRRWERELVRSFSDVLNLNDRNINDVFEDNEVANIPIRSTYSLDGDPVLHYGIIGQKYLVITKDTGALKILFDRLILPQFINQ